MNQRMEMEMAANKCQGRRNYEPIENWPPWENELQRTKFHTCRSTNADQIAPGSGDPIADEQTPPIERQWTVRRFLPEPPQGELRVLNAHSGALSCGNSDP